MAKTTDGNPIGSERVPKAQLLIDDVFLLLAAGLVVPTVIYVAWGLASLLTVPQLTR
ncbi:MAG: hypothetical protein IT307_16100 [Chloroflexi bacterium]|nr:hypothetical protein [Chloroflexota bacterium]